MNQPFARGPVSDRYDELINATDEAEARRLFDGLSSRLAVSARFTTERAERVVREHLRYRVAYHTADVRERVKRFYGVDAPTTTPEVP